MEFVGSAAQFADMARTLSAEATVRETLQRIVDFAAENVAGCDGAGILLIHDGRIVTGAWSNEVVREVEELEHQLGEGPCIDAIWQQPVFESADLREQRSQWPHFVPRALAAGIESMLGFRLFAAAAAMALVGAQVHERDLETIAGLNEALVSRDEIGQAKGILMAGRKIDADAAFALLVATSQRHNLKLRAVAADVVRTGTLPEG